MIRYSIMLSPKMVEILEDLMKTEGVKTRAEVFLRAISLLKVSRDLVGPTDHLGVINKDGKMTKRFILY